MATFKAIRIDKAEKGTTAALTQFDEAELMEGDVTVARRMVDAELQGRPRRHRQGAGGAALSDDRRHRFRRHRRAVLASAMEGRRQGRSAPAGAWARPISAPTPKRRGSRATGWCGCPRACRRATRWRSAPPAITAMLSRAGAGEARPDARSDGPIVVTGAAGGVGSVAIAVLSKLGYHVIASTGRMSEADYLKSLGAAEVIDRAELSGAGQAAGQGALGRRRSTASARPRSPTCSR